MHETLSQQLHLFFRPETTPMNLSRRLVLIAATWCLLGAAHADLSGKVIGVLDGDTIDVLVDRKPVRVRLAQIDAPESRAEFGTRAKQALSKAVYGKVVTVKSSGSDRYGRTIGTVLADGQDINRLMVGQGMAWVYRQYSTDRALLDLEAAARKGRVGLWADPNPVPPWEWRAQKRTHSALNW